MNLLVQVLKNKLNLLKNKACRGELTDKEYAVIAVTEDLIKNIEIAAELSRKEMSVELNELLKEEKIII